MGLYIGGFPYPVEIDGCTTKNAVGDAGTLGLLQMVNHSCTPNCRLVPVQTHSGIELLILEALRDITDNEEITIYYDAEASATSKQQGFTFWRWQPPSSPAAEGLHRIACGCAGVGRVCPNRLWRDEHSTRSVQFMLDAAPGRCLAKDTANSEHQLTRKRSLQDETPLVRNTKQTKAQCSVLSQPIATTMVTCTAEAEATTQSECPHGLQHGSSFTASTNRSAKLERTAEVMSTCHSGGDWTVAGVDQAVEAGDKWRLAAPRADSNQTVTG